jgi:ribosome maturation factor RimP
MGAARPFVLERDEIRMATSIHDKERALTREVTQTVETSLPGVEVLALELHGPERMTVYVDHPQGVDHALCERVTNVLRPYLDRYSIEISSPGFERPLRKPAHFRAAVGRRAALRLESPIEGRSRFRGEVVSADERAIELRFGEDIIEIPYDAIVRGNLIDEG